MRTANVTLRTHAGHAIVDAGRCHACGHPARIHNVVGCVHASCECVMTRDELTGGTSAPAAPPAEPAPPTAAAAPAPAAAATAAPVTFREPAQPVKPPRRTQPRTAEDALVDPAASSGGDADQVVTAVSPAAVTTAEAVRLTISALADLDRGAPAAIIPARIIDDPTLTQVIRPCLMAYEAWFCPMCSQRRHDPGACPDCGKALQPVHVLVVSREIT